MDFLKVFKRSRGKKPGKASGTARERSAKRGVDPAASADDPGIDEQEGVELTIDEDTSEQDFPTTLGDADLVADDIDVDLDVNVDETAELDVDLDAADLSDTDLAPEAVSSVEATEPVDLTPDRLEAPEVLNENEASDLDEHRPSSGPPEGEKVIRAIDEVKTRLDERTTEVKETVRGVSSEQNSIIEGIYRLIDQRTMDRAGLNARRREVWQVLQESLSGIRSEISGLHENVREVSGGGPVNLSGVEGLIAEFRAEHKSSVERLESALSSLRDEQWKRVEGMVQELRQAEKERVDQVISALQEETDRRVTQTREEAEKTISSTREETDRLLNEARQSADQRVQETREEADRRVEQKAADAAERLKQVEEDVKARVEAARETGVMRVFDAVRMGDQRVAAQKELFRNKIRDLEKVYQERVEHLESVLDERVQAVTRESEALREKQLNERRKTLLQMVSFFDTLDHRLRGAVAELVARERNRVAAAEDLTVSQERRMGFMKRFLGKRDFERLEAERLNLEGQLQRVDQEAVDSLRSRVEGLEDLRGLLLITLKCEGVEPFSSLGEPYDSTRHVSVDEAPAKPGQEPGTIVSVRRCGYLIDGEVLRPSEVVVASAIKTES